MTELIAAVKRGVNLTIITAGLTKDCPKGQKIFGPKNIAHYTQLFNSLEEDAERDRVKIYEFEQNKKGLHKKIVIIDDSILAGSSNLDPKCFGWMGDHDMNFIAKSQELVDQTKRIIREDIQYSRLVKMKGMQASRL
jgi:phosphatidylserine/phosphatidylglycerophosphate/cardiolipin synthase-like enzyme